MALPLPALTHLRLATVTPASNAVNDVMDAIATALAATAYYDAASRTPGTSHAWTATKEISGVTVALRLHPPTGSPAAGFAGAVAGVTAGAPTPTMISADTFVVDMLMSACFRNVPGSPTWNGWDNATPYTSADFSGYSRLFGHATRSVASITVIESIETLHILFKSDINTTFMVSFGALLEGAAATDVESDDRLYGMFTTHSTTGFNTSIHSSVASGGFFTHNSSNGTGKCVVFDPNTAGDTWFQCHNTSQQNASRVMDQDMLRGPTSDAVIGIPMWCRDLLTPFKFIGFIRNIYMISDQQGFTVIRDGGTDKLYVCGSDHALARDALGFEA